MAKNSVDLNKLRNEIDNRKQERNSVSSNSNNSAGNLAPRDSFLNELLISLKTGTPTNSTTKIKLVENKVAEKNKETPQHRVSETDIMIPTRIPIRENNNVAESPEREELLWAEIERKKKQTLSESMSQYINGGGNTTQQQQQFQPVQNQQMNLNEGYLVENVKKIVDNYLIDNFGTVVEEAIKSTILELYAVDRIKSVLNENREMVKTLVVETIREIQANNKKKTQ